MKKIQNSYKKSGVNISVANKLIKHIASVSKKNVNYVSEISEVTINKCFKKLEKLEKIEPMIPNQIKKKYSLKNRK